MNKDTITNIQSGITVTAEIALAAAPIVSIFNPAAGAAITLLAPVAKTFFINETQVLITLNTEMTNDEVVAALQASKSENWNLTPLATPLENKRM